MTNTTEGQHLPNLLLSNGVYDALSIAVKVVLPALGTLYFTLATIWGLPAAEQVVGTLAAFTTFLGVLLVISKRSYNKSDAKYDGQMVVDTSNPEKDTYLLDVNQPLVNIKDKAELTLKVTKPTFPLDKSQ